MDGERDCIFSHPNLGGDFGWRHPSPHSAGRGTEGEGAFGFPHILGITMLELIVATPRSLSLEIRDGSAFAASRPRSIWCNDQLVVRSSRNVHTLYGLQPDREYLLRVDSADGVFSLKARTRPESVRLDVREFGARGDGDHDDTAALQAAIACCPVGGTVYLPDGDWCSGPLFLRSHLQLQLAAGARLLASTERARWPVLPGRLRHADPQQVLGSWEGKPHTMHAALLNLIDLDQVQIFGPGLIEGRAAVAGWWSRPKAPHRGWRPRLVFAAHSDHVDLVGLRLQDSPSWTVHALRCSQLRCVDLDIHAPLDSPNTDGINPESCSGVQIVGARISTGDDCVALKSGKRVPGLEPVATREVLIRNCLMQHGHGAVVIGSEMAGGVYAVEARDCIFRDTDRGLRIKTRRGRGRLAVVAGVHLENVQMYGVGTPIVVNSFYWCDPDGRSPEVGDRGLRPLDEGTPSVRELSVIGVHSSATRHCAAYLLGLPENPINGVRLEDFEVSFASDPEPGYPDMAAGIEAVSCAGLMAWNVRGLVVNGLVLEGVHGPHQFLENVS